MTTLAFAEPFIASDAAVVFWLLFHHEKVTRPRRPRAGKVIENIELVWNFYYDFTDFSTHHNIKTSIFDSLFEMTGRGSLIENPSSIQQISPYLLFYVKSCLDWHVRNNEVESAKRKFQKKIPPHKP